MVCHAESHVVKHREHSAESQHGHNLAYIVQLLQLLFQLSDVGVDFLQLGLLLLAHNTSTPHHAWARGQGQRVAAPTVRARLRTCSSCDWVVSMVVLALSMPANSSSTFAAHFFCSLLALLALA